MSKTQIKSKFEVGDAVISIYGDRSGRVVCAYIGRCSYAGIWIYNVRWDSDDGAISGVPEPRLKAPSC